MKGKERPVEVPVTERTKSMLRDSKEKHIQKGIEI